MMEIFSLMQPPWLKRFTPTADHLWGCCDLRPHLALDEGLIEEAWLVLGEGR